MLLRKLTIVLLVGATFAATSVFAQSPGESSAGAGETAVTRAAPVTLPAEATPMPELQVDLDTVSRGPGGLDPDGAAASMGTETLNKDGSTDSTPASAGLRAVLEQEMAGSEAPLTDRYVSQPDDRVQVTDSSTYPERVVGWLWSQAQDDSWSTCSATLIGPSTVLTAAHCVYIHEKNGWVKDMFFLPGIVDGQNAPYGSYSWTNVNIPTGYIQNYDGQNYGSVLPWDLAVITLDQDAGNELGWLGFRVDDATNWDATIIHYPGDKPDGTMWKNSCTIPPEMFADLIYGHTCDTFAGSSGGSMYEVTPDSIYVRGINVAENIEMELNLGVRMTETYFQFVADLWQ